MIIALRPCLSLSPSSSVSPAPLYNCASKSITMAEWFSMKFARLNDISDEEEKRQLLTDITIKLRSLPTRELEEIASNLDVTGLFEHLTSDDRVSVEEIYNSLTLILRTLDPGETHRRYSAQIRKFLPHQDSLVRSLVLNELLREASSPETLPHLIHDVDLLNMIVARIGDDDLSVAKLAMDTTKKIGAHAEGTKVLYTGVLMRTIAKLLVKDDIVSFRVYEVVVDIAKASKESLEASASSGFLNSLINVLDNDDVLLQLNALEIMTDLALNERGLDYLEQRDVLRRLSEKIARANEDPLSNLLIPGLMKFFGSVARSRPNEIFSKYPVVVSALFEVIDSGDLTLLSNALDTLGLVASSLEGKYALQVLGDSMPCALKKIAEIVQKMPTELRLRGLENLALILRVEKHEQDNRILSLTKSWFDCLGEDPLGMIVTLCKQPFADIREASLEVLAAISLQTWGQEYIANCPGLVEFLLDRNVEGFKNCKEVKYRLVKNLCDADNDVFDSGTLQNLKKFIREGPFYVDMETEVATEGAS